VAAVTKHLASGLLPSCPDSLTDPVEPGLLNKEWGFQTNGI
jgi:hypothetical protein